METAFWCILSALSIFCIGTPLYRLCTPFVTVRTSRWRKVLLYGTLGVSGCMVIWVGDPNLLYTLPVFFAIFFFCTQGNPVGRLAVAMILFCLLMSVSALADTYVQELFHHNVWGELAAQLARFLALELIWLGFRRRLPREPVALSPKLWRLVLGLAAMPLCALTSVVLLTQGRYDSPTAYSMSMNLGLAVLPFVLLTSVVLLAAILVLARHEKLEQAQRLASLREVYYQGLQTREHQVRQLRHDLRNHLTAAIGLLEQGDNARAVEYLRELSRQTGLQGARRFCDNEIANAVVSAKAAELEQAGIPAEFSMSLPERLPLADTDLGALLGNALDNAREGAQQCGEPWVRLRCRMDKGLFMLRVENPMAGPEPAGLKTTKADKSLHGFGIPGMREIAERYGGTLDAGAADGVFRLLVCVPCDRAAES